ncbi:hypothetical protein [Rhodanobacter lindaniclasticus]
MNGVGGGSFNSGGESRDGSGSGQFGAMSGGVAANFGGNQSAASSDQQYASSDGSVRISSVDANNQLLIRARPSQWEEIKRAIDKLDSVPLQVQIETRILEVRLTGAFQFGVQWYLQGLSGSTVNTDSSGNPVFTPGIRTTRARSAWARAAMPTAASRSSTPSSTATCRWRCGRWRPAATPRRCRRRRWW